MKIITLSKVGYNAPSQANWAYGIWKIDCIDTTRPYCMSYTVKENFGGDSRLKEVLNKGKIPHIETKGIYTDTGTQKITGIAKMPVMDSVEFALELVDWYYKKSE